jgi:hypothetical protein
VINILDGKGWIYGNDTDTAMSPALTNVVKEEYDNEPSVRTISISDLTNGEIQNVTGLGDYKVYIIVRMRSGAAVVNDFNLAYGSRNIIAVHPEPTYPTE